MLPPSPSAQSPCPSPCFGTAQMPSSALTAAPNQPLLISSTQLIEIRCFCHFNLIGAHFSISHDDDNDFFVELLSSGNASSSPIFALLFRFVDCHQTDDGRLLQIFSSSYGRWRRSGRVRQCPADPLQLHVHVHQQHYAVLMNNTEVEKMAHVKPFSQLLLWTAEEKHWDEEEEKHWDEKPEDEEKSEDVDGQ